MIIDRGSEITVNEHFMRLIQPYDEAMLEQLREDLFHTPHTRLVHTWNGSHLDDIEIYKICKHCNLTMSIQVMDFVDANEAARYICLNQLKRSDLATEYKKYLIGQLYLYEQALNSSTKHSDSKYAIASTIAAELFISAGTVQKYNLYALAMNNIFDQDITFAKTILCGKLKLSHENTIELSRLKPEEIRAVAKSSIQENVDHITLSYIRNEVKWSHIQPRNPVSRRERSEAKIRNKVSIRQMPEYDPDAEVNSLCLTIDSWISSMNRVSSSDNFPKITKVASLKLMKKLSILEHTINVIQESMVERTVN